MAKKKPGKRAKREMKAALAQALRTADGASGWGATGGRGLRGGLAARRPNEQFMLGALLGAAAIYVLGDEKLRGKIIKSGMNLYASVIGGLEEMKEQAADIRAELEAEHSQAS